MAGAAILDVWNFKFLTVGTVKKVELHHYAKYNEIVVDVYFISVLCVIRLKSASAM